MKTIPTLETERLILRASRESDLDAIADFYGSERAKFVGGPRGRVDCWRTLVVYLGHWQMRGYGFWSLEEKATGKTAGATGFMFPPEWEEPELGWHLYTGFEGAGFAQEAVRAARQYGATHLGLDGVISYIAKENTRSLRLAERLGAVYEHDYVLKGDLCSVYRHPCEGASQ